MKARDLARRMVNGIFDFIVGIVVFILLALTCLGVEKDEVTGADLR